MIGKRLKQLRKTNHMTQKDFAKIFHLDSSTICKYESDAASPSALIITEIAKYFHISTDFLLGMVDSPQSTIQINDKKVEIAPNTNAMVLIGRTGEVAKSQLSDEQMQAMENLSHVLRPDDEGGD